MEIIGTATLTYTNLTSITGRCITLPLKSGSVIKSGYDAHVIWEHDIRFNTATVTQTLALIVEALER